MMNTISPAIWEDKALLILHLQDYLGYVRSFTLSSSMKNPVEIFTATALNL